MVTRRKIDEKDDIRRYARASTNPVYEKNVLVLKDIFNRSLLAHRGKYPLLKLQEDLFWLVLQCDAERRKSHRAKELYGRARQKLAASDADVERIKLAQRRFEEMQDAETAWQWLLDRTRSVGDGIAWRFLDYDRIALRLLAEHEPISAPQINKGLISEVRELVRLAQQEERHVLLNSITNVLRVGDITIHNSETGDVELVEVKSGKKIGSRVHRQSEYRAYIENSIESGVYEVGGTKLHKMMARKPLMTHVFSIERAMREAEQNFGASRMFGDYMAVAVFSKKMSECLTQEEQSVIRRQHLDRLHAVKRHTSDVLLPPMDSLFPIAHLVPNVAPYAIFPIEPRFRFALMTGEFWVISVINLSGLGHWLEKRGWETEILHQRLESLDMDELLSVGFLDDSVLQVSRNGRGTTIGLTSLLVAATEFHMRESIELLIEDAIEKTPSKPPRSGEPKEFVQFNYPNTGKYAWD